MPKKFSRLGLWWHCLITFHRACTLDSPERLKRRGCLTCEGLEGEYIPQTEPQSIEEMERWADIVIGDMGLDDEDRTDGGLFSYQAHDEEGQAVGITVRSSGTCWLFRDWPTTYTYLTFIKGMADEGDTNAAHLDEGQYEAALRGGRRVM